MTSSFVRRVVVPALIVTALVGIASTLAVPDEKPLDEMTPEEIARIDAFVERFRHGQRLMGSGRDDDAEQVFRDLITAEPEAAAVHHALGTLLQFRDRPDEATAELIQAARLAPEDAVIQRDVGLDLLRRSRPADAEPYLARARRLWPDEIEVLVTHGTALRALGRGDEARAAFREAVQVSPGSVDARVGLAACVVSTHPEKAIELVAELPHNFADVSLVHGLALEQLGRLDSAIEHLHTAAVNTPRNAAGLGMIGETTRALIRLGAGQSAVDASALWCELSGSAPALAAASARAEALAGAGRSAEALGVLETSTARGAPAEVVQRAFLIRAAIVLATGDAVAARKAFERIADQDLPSVERLLARRVVGRIDDTALVAALGAAPALRNDAAWASGLAALLAGDPEAAAGHLRRARELSSPRGEFPGSLLPSPPPPPPPPPTSAD